ncbi:MAG: globin [Parvibaculum sp.]
MPEIQAGTKQDKSAIDGDAIMASLELVAERCGDPTPQVYSRLFAANPEMEALFVMDRDGMVRGNMLAQALDGIMDFIDTCAYAKNLIRTEIVNHEGVGVPPTVFATFFATIRDTFREILGDEWTAAMEAAWENLLAALADTISAPA